MKKLLLFLSFVIILSCHSGEDFPKAENALDAAREYIDGTLKGEFNKAQAYLQPTAYNNKYLDSLKDNYYQFNDIQRQDYRKASIIIQKEHKISDKESIIFFQNSFDKKNDSIRVINAGNVWQVTLQ